MRRDRHSSTFAGTIVRLVLTLVLFVLPLPAAMSFHDTASERGASYSESSPLSSGAILMNTWCDADECRTPSQHEYADVLSLCSQCPSGNVSVLASNFSNLSLSDGV